MLVVKVEVWPGGDPDRAVEISRIGAANVSKLAALSDYEVTALLNRDGEEKVLTTFIDKHERHAGWPPLVRRILTHLLISGELTENAPYDARMARLLRKGDRV